MSLPRLAIRIATVGALRDRTWAETRVRDSEITPFDTLAQSERQPFIAVYTDDGEFDPSGLQIMTSQGALSVVIEIGVTAQMQADEAWTIPTTDAGMELTLDCIERQVKVALMDPGNPWGEMWRRLVAGVEKIKTIRGASAEHGVRYAGRQLEIVVRPYAEPAYGTPLAGLWADFVALLQQDGEFSPLAPIVTQMIETADVPLSWQMVQAQLGLSKPLLDVLLLAHRHDQGDQDIAEIVAGQATPA